MKTRIALAVIILTSLTLCSINTLKLRERVIQLQNKAQHEAELRLLTQNELARMVANSRRVQEALAIAMDEMEAAQTAENVVLSDARAQAIRADRLAEELSKARHEADELKVKLFQPENTNGTQGDDQLKHIAQLQSSLVRAKRDYVRLAKRIQAFDGLVAPCVWNLPEEFGGNVVAVDAKWAFLVLDAGEDQGSIPGGEVLINRKGSLVGKATISQVFEKRCIANIMPGWGSEAVVEGDSFFAAR